MIPAYLIINGKEHLFYIDEGLLELGYVRISDLLPPHLTPGGIIQSDTITTYELRLDHFTPNGVPVFK